MYDALNVLLVTIFQINTVFTGLEKTFCLFISIYGLSLNDNPKSNPNQK